MKKLLLTALIVRLGLQLIAGLAIRYLPFTPSYPHWDIVLVNQGPEWLWFWGGFDGVHYLNIAEKGYEYGLTQAFFPVYPLLIRWLNVFHNNLLTALVISHLSFIVFLYFFVKLGRLDFKAETVKWAGILLLLYPASFFFFSVYTESLFLLLAAACFYLARRKRWFPAAVMAGLASATRLVGIFLLPALLWEYYQKRKPKYLQLGLYSLIASSGLLLYLNFLQRRFHDFLIFIHSQPGFGAGRQVNELVLPYQVMVRYIKMFVSVSPANDIYPVLVFEFLITLFWGGLLVYGFVKKLRLSYLIFMIPALLLPTLTGTFASMPRYGLAAFPLFYLVGNLKNKPVKIILALCFAVTLIWALLRFSRGLWLS